MKRGGQMIYAGPLGERSCKLIEYFEVSIFVLVLMLRIVPSKNEKTSYLFFINHIITYFITN